MGGYLVVGFVVLVFVLVALGLASNRKRAAARRQRAIDMGFSPVPQPDPALRERLKALHRRHGGGRVGIRNVFCRADDADYQIYILDTVTEGNQDSSPMEGVAVLVSPHLQVPRFTLFPMVPGQGFLAAAANRMLAGALAKGGAETVEFPGFPRFGQRFALLADSEAEVREAFTDEVLAHLSEAGTCIVEAGGDTLMVSGMPHRVAEGSADQVRVEESLREAVALFGLLRK